MPTRNGQFDYPETPWSQGKMAKMGPMRGGDPGREYRELEGQRKRRESRVSALGESDMPPTRDDVHYSELERQVGTENMQYLKEMDEFVSQMNVSGRANSKHWQNWEKLRQQYLDMWNRPDSGVVSQKEKATAEWEGPGPTRAG